MKHLLQDYWVEFVALAVVTTGIFLVVIDVSLLQQLRFLFHQVGVLFAGLEGRFYTWLREYITRFGLGDLLGWLLVLGGLAFVLWRGRHHFYRSEYWKAVDCPKCGSGLHRIHRTTWDRFLSRTLLLGARRYLCKNPECGWSGLRDRREEDRRHKRHHTPEID